MITGVVADGQTGHPEGSQTDRITQLYGTNITNKEYLETGYPEELEVLRQGLTGDAFETFCNQKVYWGDDHPELPYGANVWDENGPVNLSALNETEKERYGIDDALIGGDGYRILDRLKWRIREGQSVAFFRSLPGGSGDITCDLNWLDTDSSLKLTLFAPDGMMGPYYDISDGKADGRIFLRISRDANLSCGDWYVVIEAERIDPEKTDGVQPFIVFFY
ncbi:MAG: hypothetical protein WCX22_13045 [Methanoregula sp.]